MRKALLIAAALTLASAGAAAAQEHPESGHGPPPHPPTAPPQGAHPGPGGPGEGFRGPAPPQGVHAGPAHGPPGGPSGWQPRAAPEAAMRGAPAVGYAHFDGFHGQGVGPHGPVQVFYRGRNFRSFHAAPFYYPGGWGYRRWGVGQVLPGLFLSPSYFIANWAGYGLGPPPPGLEWVRYGPDALLVNVYTGQVVDTVYGVFWW